MKAISKNIILQKFILNLIFFAVMFMQGVSVLFAQTNTQLVLTSVEKNNKVLHANTRLMEAKALEYKTGLSLPNPEAEYDYMLENDPGSSYEHDFVISQSFEFPTVYSKKRQLSREQIVRLDYHQTLQRRDILIDAKRTYIQLVFSNKLEIHLMQIKENAERLYDAMTKKLNTGDGNILEVNKARLQLLEADKQWHVNVALKNNLTQKLIELNGGVELAVAETEYDPVPLISDFAILEKEIEDNDPVLKILEQHKVISQTQLKLTRSMSFPKMELGYRHQSYPGQTFNGIHTGITIPLWENKNRVKLRKAEIVYADLNLQSHLTEHYFQIKQHYNLYLNLRDQLATYTEVFESIKALPLLTKAFEEGHISMMEYFIELNFYNSAYKNYLETEKELQEVVAELFKHKL